MDDIQEDVTTGTTEDTESQDTQDTQDTQEIPETTESDKLVELRRRLALYKDMETNILTGGAQSYNVGNRQLSRYGVSLNDIQRKIAELEEAIHAEEYGSSRWRGNLYPTDD